MTLTFSGYDFSEQVVTTAMFGGNNMFKYNLINGQGASFNNAANILGVTGIRFPGGSMTEQDFDVTQPNAPPASWAPDRPFVGITDFLNYAAESGRDATIVLPTSKMFVGEPDANSDIPRELDSAYLASVRAYVELLLTHGDSGSDALPDTPISAFEIGNEYWGQNAMTATEYGVVVNALCAELAKVFEEKLGANVEHPQVLIQMGDPWGGQFSNGIYSSLNWEQRLQQCNQNIIDQLSNPDSIGVITGLVQHYYYSKTESEFSDGSQSVNYIDRDWKIWSDAGFGDLDLAITEWNVKQSNAIQHGLKGASVLVEQMEQMVNMGVDSAFAWPVQGWKTSLAGDYNQDPILSPAGAAFQLMASDLVGLRAIDSNITGGTLEVNAFASEKKAVIFVCSRTEGDQHVSIDVSELVSGYSSAVGIKLGIGAGFATDDPEAAAVLSNFSTSQLISMGNLEFDLGSFELMKISFVLPSGVSLIGNASSEHLRGGFGGDTVQGAAGNDSIVGGKGLDRLDGGVGNDLVSGWGGNDVMFGDSGNDLVFGQSGFDKLFGGSGSDTIRGGDDGDRLDGGAGIDFLFGGNGEDLFVFGSPGSVDGSVDRIGDLQVGVDTIVLDNDFFVGVWTGTLGESAFRVSSTSAAVKWTDRIIYNEASGQLIYDRDGSRSDFSGVVFAQLDPGLILHHDDFAVI